MTKKYPVNCEKFLKAHPDVIKRINDDTIDSDALLDMIRIDCNSSFREISQLILSLNEKVNETNDELVSGEIMLVCSRYVACNLFDVNPDITNENTNHLENKETVNETISDIRLGVINYFEKMTKEWKLEDVLQVNPNIDLKMTPLMMSISFITVDFLRSNDITIFTNRVYVLRSFYKDDKLMNSQLRQALYDFAEWVDEERLNQSFRNLVEKANEKLKE